MADVREMMIMMMMMMMMIVRMAEYICIFL